VALITQARLEHKFGANRAQIWLTRYTTSDWRRRRFSASSATSGAALVKTRRRRPKQLKLFEKEYPGDSVQVDVKVVAGPEQNGSVHRDSRLHPQYGCAFHAS
jgi:hypothetical protein